MEKTINAICKNGRGDVLRSLFTNNIPYKAFVRQELMSTDKRYDSFRAFLKVSNVLTPSTWTKSKMIVLRLLVPLYDDEMADRIFAVSIKNWKAMKQTDLADQALYGDEDNESEKLPSLNHSDKIGATCTANYSSAAN